MYAEARTGQPQASDLPDAVLIDCIASENAWDSCFAKVKMVGLDVLITGRDATSQYGYVKAIIIVLICTR
jgi:hypothetical protein